MKRSTNLQVVMTEQEKDLLRQIARADGRSMGDMLRRLVRLYAEQKQLQAS